MKEPLTDHDFSMGSPEAWDPPEQKSLHTMFLPIHQFAQISQSERVFLCGRRGAGKSAIAVMLQSHRDFHFRASIQGEAAEYGKYMNVAKTLADIRDAGKSVNVKETVRRLWAWALPVTAMQLVVNEEPDLNDISGPASILATYLDLLPKPLHRTSSIGHLLYSRA